MYSLPTTQVVTSLYSVKPVQDGQWIAKGRLCKKMCLLLGIYSENQHNITCNGSNGEDKKKAKPKF